MSVASPEAVERRVMSLVTNHPRTAEDEATARTLSAAIQMLLPGERARPHRHTMNALRFVLEGHGATTLVDGKPCPMHERDLILTPAWTWHEHVHDGDRPMIWLDVLDVPLHLWLGNVVFQPGPVNDAPVTMPDAAFAAANVLPVVAGYDKGHSPVFRYPYAAACGALAGVSPAEDGSRRVRYVNPLTGGGAMALMDVGLLQIEAKRPTTRTRTNSNAIVHVVEGSGTSIIGGRTIRWQPSDIFSIPQNNWAQHVADASGATLFVVSDRDAMVRLGLLREEQCDPTANLSI
jgi:gentisate 1,2-dioxygenase